MATVWIRHPRYSLLIVVTLITTFYLLFVPHHEELAFGIPDTSLASRVRRSHAIYDKFLVQRKGMIKKWGPEPKDISLYVVTRVFFSLFIKGPRSKRCVSADSLLTYHLGLLTLSVSLYISLSSPFLQLDTCIRGLLYRCIQLPTWGGTSWCFGRWREVGLWSFTSCEKTRLCSLLFRWVSFYKLVSLNLFCLYKRIDKASTTSHLSKRRSYPILRIVKFGDTISVSLISDLKFQRRLNIVPISFLMDFQVLINMDRRINHLCIHLRP